MKFHINKIILWFKNESEPRTLDFLPNKVNVITGGSGTGKSSILSIFDYCMLSTKANIPQEMINENIAWYGLDFRINEKDFLLARKSPVMNTGSDEIYFSSDNTFPQKLAKNNDIKQVKSILEKEFGIDENLKIPFGGKHISAGSKISYRYFLLFNTLSEDTIAHTKEFFDYHLYDRDKYIEALDRIFYLAIGVDDVGNVLAKEKIDSLEKDLTKIEKRKKALDKEEKLFAQQIVRLINRAQEYDLIERQLFTIDAGRERLQQLVNQFRTATYSNNMQQVDELNKRKRTLFRQIRNLERFNVEYDTYKKNLNGDYESLRPIAYLNENFGELIPTLEVKTFLDSLEASLQTIREEIAKKKPISANVKSEVTALRNQVIAIDAELATLPTSTKDYTDEAQKFIFIGELKSQLAFYENKWELEIDDADEQGLLDEIESLKGILKNNNEKRRLILSDLEGLIQTFFDAAGDSMGVYKAYKVFVDVSEKSLKLRKAKELQAQATIGSKSNYMFLHLFLFLGLHEHFISLPHSYVPQFLILDQPSQPYYEGTGASEKTEDIAKDDDKAKLQSAFQLLNDFITKINSEYNTEFQIIMLEHAPERYWEEKELENFQLVEEFRNGNALIPERATLPAAKKAEPEKKPAPPKK
ncbi:DUF3732 domain-containing protein [Mucilaginibacter aquariorum]|uniref:DUF3732 domain-containing protein n=1 Tax=Mucilaginibacter aquariorum TaxID=2967225 RepID=A0ABT1SZ27_9SPHI|nr:DUF3732 domain-containing protein [Mucilaginibacter aquariorum]MCQ6957611.1 DUF3732 domain-containing protein [Mucilaginibacter aquariorum]